MADNRVNWIGLIAASVLALPLLSMRLFFESYRVPTTAMEPTVPRGARVIVRMTQDVQRGDLAAFVSNFQPDTKELKRVVAGPGDTLLIRDDRLFVNGVEVEEPYVQHTGSATLRDLAELRVPPGHFFVLGDNRDEANDSRYYGPVPQESIEGRVVVVVSTRGFERVKR